MRHHTYQDLIQEFLCTLYVKVVKGPQCQEGYISFYLQGQFYELNLSAFNELFGFSPSLDVSLRQVPMNLTPMCLRVKFQEILITTQVHVNALLLGTLAYG